MKDDSVFICKTFLVTTNQVKQFFRLFGQIVRIYNSDIGICFYYIIVISAEQALESFQPRSTAANHVVAMLSIIHSRIGIIYVITSNSETSPYHPTIMKKHLLRLGHQEKVQHLSVENHSASDDTIREEGFS